jgi:SNF2 family DNA or RNA helicase
MEYVTYDDNFIYVRGTTKEMMALNADFVKSKNAYKLPINYYTASDVWEHTQDEEMLGLIKQEQAKYKQIKNIKSKDDIVGDERLRPYQRVDVEMIKQHPSVAIFNEQRTGKTPTILLATKPLLGKGIVVCPSSLKLNWKSEYENWLNRTDAEVVSGTPKKRAATYDRFVNGDTNFMIMSYETLRQDLTRLLPSFTFDVLIVDEAHRLRNYLSKQSISLYYLGKKAKHIYPMTGTPAVNHPSDVFGILKLLQPNKFTSYWQFVERYFGYVEGRFGRDLLDLKKDKVDEFTELLDMYSTQRKRSEVMKWIPKIHKRPVFLELGPKQKKHYDQIIKEFSYGENIIPNVIAQLTRLRQVCLDPALLQLDGESPKTHFLLEFLEDNDGKVIVFSVFSSFLKKLKEIIPNSELLIGEMNEEQKSAAVYNIQYGNTRVLLSNIQVGGTGWTLDNVDTVIFTDRSFNPVDNDQAADRFIPTNPNTIYGAKQIIDLVMDNTIERKIARLLMDKLSIIKYVNNYGLNALVNYDERENNNNAGVSD